MKRSIEYLDEAKVVLGVDSDYALAKALKTTTQAVSNYRTGKTLMDDYHCIRVAQVLGIDPMEIIAAAQEEREKNEDKKAFWQDFRKARGTITGAVLALTIAMGSALSPAPAHASTSGQIYIMSNTMPDFI